MSFLRDSVELRIDYSIVRLLNQPLASSLAGPGASPRTHRCRLAASLHRADRCSADFAEDDHLRLVFGEDTYIEASLRSEDRSGPEALHLMPADRSGEVLPSNMWIWSPPAEPGRRTTGGLGTSDVNSPHDGREGGQPSQQPRCHQTQRVALAEKSSSVSMMA